jgi:hypothetical protein
LNFPTFAGEDEDCTGWVGIQKIGVHCIGTSSLKPSSTILDQRNYDDPLEALSYLRQMTTINAYQEVFKKLSHKVDDILENFLVGYFIKGLKDDIQLDVRVKQPKMLSETTSVAHLIEE